MTTTTALSVETRRMAGLRGSCGTCHDPVTHDGRKWVHDHAHQRCLGHQQDKPWAFACGPVCDFPHEVGGAYAVA